MKPKSHKIIAELILILFLCAGTYLAVALYYREGFCINTWINGIYCTGKTVDEVNLELLSQTEAPVVTIIGREGEEEKIDLADCGYRPDYRKPLEVFLEEQNPFLWPEQIWNGRGGSVLPEVALDEEALYARWQETSFVKKEQESPPDVVLDWTQDGYALKDTMLQRMDQEAGYARLLEAARRGDAALDLTEQDIYADYPYTKEQEALFALWEKVSRFQSCVLFYDMGEEKLTLSGAEIGRFLAKDANGLPILDGDGRLVPDAAEEDAFLEALLEKYNTVGKERTFQSTRGELVTVPAGTYGTELNAKAEGAYLKEALQRCAEAEEPVREQHVPAYVREAYCRGENDIGDTYIEVDMTDQMLYYYEDGKCVIETPVVTGNTRRRMGTPEGVFYVYAMQRNRTLRGENYASFVKYWMPVYRGVGLHDASWRDKFGGEIYKTNGSHGCINMPRSVAAELYEKAEIGMPVVVFY